MLEDGGAGVAVDAYRGGMELQAGGSRARTTQSCISSGQARATHPASSPRFLMTELIIRYMWSSFSSYKQDTPLKTVLK